MLDEPLVKYTVLTEKNNKISLKRDELLKKAGHCRLTMEFVQENEDPSYEIAYSGNVYHHLFFLEQMLLSKKTITAFIFFRVFLCPPPTGRLDIFRFKLQQPSHCKKKANSLIKKIV